MREFKIQDSRAKITLQMELNTFPRKCCFDLAGLIDDTTSSVSLFPVSGEKCEPLASVVVHNWGKMDHLLLLSYNLGTCPVTHAESSAAEPEMQQCQLFLVIQAVLREANSSCLPF
ncbi:hypothetical protein VNO78_21848 [Psophocarpus tetragonolobus]|uniref:Uncharacterized protein n=1 Tax=Psophocarpus tetragonolobus TaxID=3891 RepID=A0AAN9SCA0_PSOTE